MDKRPGRVRDASLGDSRRDVSLQDLKSATAGGTMYHDAGYAGLPDTDHPTAGLLNKEVHRDPGGHGEIANVRDDTIVERPLSAFGALFFEQIHAGMNR
jgi:hypothetical protein